MYRVLLTFLMLICFSASAFCGEYEKAIKENNKLLVYFYAPKCTYCVKFAQIYELLEKNYNNKCKFLKIDITTDYGKSLIQEFNVYYVPYVFLLNNEKRLLQKFDSKCLLNYSCMKDAIEKF